MLAGCCWFFFSSLWRWSARSGLRATRQAPNLADLLNSTLRPTTGDRAQELAPATQKSVQKSREIWRDEGAPGGALRARASRLSPLDATSTISSRRLWPSRTDSIESTVATRRHLPRSLPASACDTIEARIPLSNPSACPAEPGGTHSHPPPAAAPRHPQNRATMDAETIKGACPRPRAKNALHKRDTSKPTETAAAAAATPSVPLLCQAPVLGTPAAFSPFGRPPRPAAFARSTALSHPPPTNPPSHPRRARPHSVCQWRL
jgi:hypothetical protein